MVEIGLAAVVVLILLASAGGESVVRILFASGAAATALGLAVGIPAGVLYHLRLHRALSLDREAPPRWWWHPTRLHADLSLARLRPVMPWFHVGAAGFLLALTGCALILAAVLVQ